MATLKEQAVNILHDVPEEKMSYVVDVLKWLNGTFKKTNGDVTNIPRTVSGEVSDALIAWQEFKKYKGIIQYEIDEKAELARARDEKYADFN